MTPSGSFPGRRAEGIPLQAKAVGDHEDRGQGHRGGREDRVQQAERGQRDRRHVVAERPGEVGPDRREGGARQPDRVGHAAQVVAEQDHVGGADRHVGAGAEGEPEVGGGQRRAVNQRAARRIDQQGVGLHQRKLARTDHAAGCIVERAMQGENVRGGKQLMQRHTT